MSKKSDYKKRMNTAWKKLPKEKRPNALLKIKSSDFNVEIESEYKKSVTYTVFEPHTRGRRKGEVNFTIKNGEVKDINWGWRLDKHEKSVVEGVIFKLEVIARQKEGKKKAELPEEYLRTESESRWRNRSKGL